MQEGNRTFLEEIEANNDNVVTLKSDVKVQQKLYQKLQREFKRKILKKKNMEIRKRNETKKLKRMEKQNELLFNQQREAEEAGAAQWEKKE